MSLPLVPRHFDADAFNFLQEVRDRISRVYPSRIPPSQPSNLTVTPIAAANQITFTRAPDAQGHIVRFGPNQSWNASTDFQVDVGDSNVFTDHVGDGAKTRYYWVLSKRNDLYSEPIGPVKAISLAIGTGVNLPVPPPSSGGLRVSDETGLPVALQPRGNSRFAR